MSVFDIPFNKPFIVGKELYYIAQAVTLCNLAGDGHFTQQCSRTLEERFGIPRVLMTPSATAALELAAQLCRLGPGDEVILPSFTFVSTANAFVRLGARPCFVDIRADTLNLDESLVSSAITANTRAIFPVHYAGIGCAMEPITALARKHDLWVVEDAAQAVNSFYRGRALGSIGHLAAYSFHETKNYISGEGGALCINDSTFLDRADILRDKGTNRKQFFRGQTDKYTWVDVGSSYVPSEIVCAFLAAQLEHLDTIAQRRRDIFERYYEALRPIEARGDLRLPHIPADCQPNFHMMYVIVADASTRERLLETFHRNRIQAVFHYVPLHSSPMGRSFGYCPEDLPHTEHLSRCLLRLPFYHDITAAEQDRVIETLSTFFGTSV